MRPWEIPGAASPGSQGCPPVPQGCASIPGPCSQQGGRGPHPDRACPSCWGKCPRGFVLPFSCSAYGGRASPPGQTGETIVLHQTNYRWHVEQLVMSVTVRNLYFLTSSVPRAS